MKNVLIKIIITGMTLVCLTQAKPLDLALGARPQGMGGAFVAIVDDVNSPYWNPAGMGLLESMEFGASNRINQELGGADYGIINISVFNGIVPVKGVGSVGYNWQMVLAGLEEGDPDGSGFREDLWREHTFSLSLSRKLWDKLLVFKNTSVGVNLNRYAYNTEYYHGAGVGFDLGLLTMFPHDIRLGIMARSLAADIEGEMFPPEFRLGLGYILKLTEIQNVIFASDVLLKQNVEYSDMESLNPVKYNLKFYEGVEYSHRMKDFLLQARIGGNFTARRDRSVSGFGANATTGLGFGYKYYKLDYAFKINTAAKFGLGPEHHVAFVFKK
jgi:hypothetical protein